MTQSPRSLIDILLWRAIYQPNQLAYRYLVDGECDEILMTYQDLDRRARSIAALLQSYAKAGDRALLIFPPGLDFIAAYFGCLYAGIIAVPAYPPHPARPERNLPVILRVAADARPTVALLPSSLLDVIKAKKELEAQFSGIHLLVTDSNEVEHLAGNWQQRDTGGSDLAFLQYTSGSTTAPRGVMISHGNLLHNLGLIENSFGLTSQSQTVFWLPPYHDMGLIGGILQALYTGYTVTLMPHLMFLQRPIRWLEAITRFQATCSGAPNFAYDLCVRKVTPKQMEQLDLSKWEVAFNGAEPVYHQTLDLFANHFATCGFRRKAFLPCYGLAESTLLVTGGPRSRTPLMHTFRIDGLANNSVAVSGKDDEAAKTLVSSGKVMDDLTIRIVDPESLVPCKAEEIGEIWISGPSVACGYWDKPEESATTFGARLAGTDREGPFLRTGDLGFLYAGELYITGRIKNLIISDGKNHYSHDIERTVEAAHLAVRPGGSAVFSINNGEREGVIVIAETEPKSVGEERDVINAIRQKVATHHDLSIHDIRLIKPGGILKTTSGKIKHFACKECYLDGSF